MAKTLSPLFSASAHGKLARSLIYSKKKSGQLTRAMHYPKKEPSLKQWTRRHIVGLLTAHWQCMTDDEHSSWNDLSAASSLNLPGYQYFLKLAQADLYTHDGMIAYFSFNESTGENCYCHVCNMIVGVLKPSYPANCPTRISSFKKEYGNALLFDGDDDYVQVTYNPRFEVTSELTLEAWFRLNSISAPRGGIITNWRAPPTGNCFLLHTLGDILYFFYSPDGSTYDFIKSPSFLTLEWTHAVATFSLDNVTRLFVNAVQCPDTGDLISLNTKVQDLEIGSGYLIYPFLGAIDEVRLYNRALGLEEIKKHYQLLRLDKKRQPLLRL